MMKMNWSLFTDDRKFSIVGSTILIAVIGGYGLYQWLADDLVTASTILFLMISIAFLFHSLTWGNLNGKHENEKDELEKQVTLISSKISYYVLLVLMTVILFVTEGVGALNDIENIPLVLVIGLAFVTLPATEYFISKKYQ